MVHRSRGRRVAWRGRNWLLDSAVSAIRFDRSSLLKSPKNHARAPLISFFSLRNRNQVALLGEMATSERYLVIGGVGFLGSYVVQALISRGEKHVAVYDLSKPGKEDVIEGATYFSGDILDETQLHDCLNKVRRLIARVRTH